MSFDTNYFDFDEMKKVTSTDPFVASTSYETDTRFYTLPKNENGEGSALIAFLPDPERYLIQKMNKINTTITKNGKKRFVSEWSPTTVNLPDPFQERWQSLYNSGNQDEARVFSRSIRYVTNIKVIKDPQKPENNGKIFLYEMSQKMCDKLQQALNPSEQDIELGANKKEIFNPLKGFVFKLVAKKGSNGIINYDSSEFVQTTNAIYQSIDDAVNDIKTNAHKLSDLVKPESFKSYDELVKKLKWVTFDDATTTVTVSTATQPTPEVHEAKDVQTSVQEQSSQPVANQQKDDIDSLLDDLMK